MSARAESAERKEAESKNLPGLRLIASGKVRDVYEVDEESLLFVCSDRISAFDVIMKSKINGKGRILTQISEFWFQYLKNEMPNHFITSEIEKMPSIVHKYKAELQGRAMLVRKLKILPVEAIVRGYITGSAMLEYKAKGTVHDIPMPRGLVESQKLEKILFTPSTKAEMGDHDINIHPSKLVDILGSDYARQVEQASLKLYTKARDYALEKGIIIADTKFEFGIDQSGALVLADEVLTPDSSRFWPLASYQENQTQPSFDKQFLRDYLVSINFDKKEGIELPSNVIEKTMDKYKEICLILTGKPAIL